MTDLSDDRWQRLERIYHETLARPVAERADFLRTACAGDTGLVREITSLVALDEEAASFLERPALEDAAADTLLTSGAFVGRRLGNFEVRSLLGAGGMGEVYLAHDLKMKRDVALKVLRVAAAADQHDLHRFEEEAHAASILNHDNVVYINSVGAEDGVAYIEMEYVQGRTLREYAAGAPLALDPLIDLATQLADGLTHAHLNGVVHRDLKPDNIMVTREGGVKILDFGIARREVAAERAVRRADVAISTSVTLRAGIFGTIGYMSPEQVAGEPARPASDQFSLGVILYELATGHRPFQRDTAQTTIDAILHDDPEPIRALAPNIPRVVRQLIERCLAKRPEDRFAATRDLADELHRYKAKRERDAQMRVLWQRFAKGVAVTMVVALFGTLAAWQLWWREPPDRTFAILPFTTSAPSGEDVAYLGDGMAEALIPRFSNLPHLSVTSRDAALSFARQTDLPVDLTRLDAGGKEAIRSLNAGTILTGAIEATGERLRITPSLFDVSTGAARLICCNPIERSRAELIDIQDQIAQAIVAAMRLRVPPDVLERLAERPTRDDKAYDLYLQGQHLVRQLDAVSARTLFEEAISRDSRFALAHAAYAGTYWTELIDGMMRPTDGWPIANRAMYRALMLDPTLPAAHAGRAVFMFVFDWNWSGAEGEWEAALQAPARDIEPETLLTYAFEQWATGKPEHALALMRRARNLNPFDPQLKTYEADYHLQLGHLAEAERLYREALNDVRPDDSRPVFGLAEVQKRLGQFDDAIATLREAYAIEHKASAIRSLETASGEAGLRAIEHEAALLEVRVIEEERRGGTYVSPLLLAEAHARAGSIVRALDLLDAAREEHAAGLVFLGVNRSWDALREQPRFRAVLNSVGLPNHP